LIADLKRVNHQPPLARHHGLQQVPVRHERPSRRSWAGRRLPAVVGAAEVLGQVVE
jgi:hypothetical protein